MSRYPTTAGQLSESDTYAKLSEHLRLAQEDAAMLSHITGLSNRPAVSNGWLLISEQLKRFNHVVTNLAAGKLT